MPTESLVQGRGSSPKAPVSVSLVHSFHQSLLHHQGAFFSQKRMCKIGVEQLQWVEGAGPARLGGACALAKPANFGGEGEGG